jgi:hypothetical protein
MPIRFSPILTRNREVTRPVDFWRYPVDTHGRRVTLVGVGGRKRPQEDVTMATSFGVYRISQAQASRDGSSAKPAGVPEAVFSDFDSAYQAAYDAGGDRWVISSRGSSEYVPKAES